MKIPEFNPILGFRPSFNTCYIPRLFFEKKCKECQFRPYVLCTESPNYNKYKDEYEKE